MAKVRGHGTKRRKTITLLIYFNDELVCSLRSTPEMYDDYHSLAWTKAVSNDEEEDETWRR
jgi:hypothetical protein